MPFVQQSLKLWLQKAFLNIILEKMDRSGHSHYEAHCERLEGGTAWGYLTAYVRQC